VLDWLLLAAISGGVVYLAMYGALRRASRRLAERAASEARFRDLTELSADWFWETDAEHRITWISAGGSVATFFGNMPTFGKRFWEIPRVEVEPRALEAHLERLGQQLPFFDLEIQRTDDRGARLIHIISGQSRVTPRGQFLGYRGVGRDVTEQRRAERAVFEAKERVELALDGGNLAEWHFDVEHDELYAGDGWVRFLGHGRSPAVGKGAMLYDMMHPEDRERSRGVMVRALKGELEEYVDEFRVPTRAGDWKWLQARGRVVERDAEGRALRVSGIIADVDSRKRAETALQEAEQRYRSLVDLAPNGVMVHSRGVIAYANPAAARLLKAASPAQLVGLELEALFHPSDLPRVRERQRSLMTAPSAVGFEERHLRCLDGSEIIVEAAAVSFLEGDHLVVQAVFRDVTEERKARQALAEREQRFRDVVHASGEYVWETDAQWRYTYLSERVEAVLGYAATWCAARSRSRGVSSGSR
jgi:PAS domain S-box-containing protein